jgi:hypothetical protein
MPAPVYARLFSGFGDVGYVAASAVIYTELRWREFSDKTEMDGRFERLKGEYRNILSENKRKGIRAFVVRVFSLRGLAYL